MAKYKVGDKFVVEVEKLSESYLSSDDLDICSSKDACYSLKGLPVRIWEHDLDSLEGYDESTDSYYKGVQFAESVYKKLHNLTGFELKEIFNMEGGSAWNIIEKYSVCEIDSLISNYVPKFNVGDEFIISDNEAHCTGNHDAKHRAVVTYVQEYFTDRDSWKYHILFETGKTAVLTASELLSMMHKRIGSCNKLSDSKVFESVFRKEDV